VNVNPRAQFFEGIADRWDGWEDLEALAKKLATGLEELEVGASETVLDVGCGTGNLTRALLTRLSAAGRVVSVDLSPRMIGRARSKLSDARASWQVADARHVPLAGEACDRVICYSVWPHFEEPEMVARELQRVLRPGGCLHVWHLGSRERINSIHASAGEAVRHDVLPPAAEVGRLLEKAGFCLSAVVETPERYLVTAVKPAS
jgi:demethylmenaquinone methyltransferase/2-methoxy-6-polyprenyl-1,4-benzoquinol methylase